MHFFADYHTHTHYSHGQGTVAQNAAVAKQKGLEELAISDHGPAHMFGIGIASLEILDRIRQETDAAEKEHAGLRVLVGIESNVVSRQGDIDLPLEFRHKVDVLQVGLHALVRPKNWGEGLHRYALHYLRGLSSSIRAKSLVLNTDSLVNAIFKNKIDIITHPGYHMAIDTRELARAAAQQGTALEINASHDHITEGYIKIAADEGVHFVVGSDAHTPERVGDFAKGIQLLERVGVPVEQIRNAR